MPAGAGPGGAAAAGARAASSELITRLNRVRDVCNGILGAVGESVVNKHYAKAKGELEHGSGPEAIEEAINQIARAANTSVLQGSAVEPDLSAIQEVKMVIERELAQLCNALKGNADYWGGQQ